MLVESCYQLYSGTSGRLNMTPRASKPMMKNGIDQLQLVVKVLLFISASIAVFYKSLHVFSVITLALTITEVMRLTN